MLFLTNAQQLKAKDMEQGFTKYILYLENCYRPEGIVYIEKRARKFKLIFGFVVGWNQNFEE